MEGDELMAARCLLVPDRTPLLEAEAALARTPRHRPEEVEVEVDVVVPAFDTDVCKTLSGGAEITEVGET